MMGRFLIALLAVCLWASGTSARELAVATWNLGWHMDRASVRAWIDECSKTYLWNEATQKWVQSNDAAAMEAWDADVFKIEGWDHSRFPVCNIYWAGGTVRVTEASYLKRQEQIRSFISKSVPADIIAFQEVSGIQAVKEVLPNADQDYEFCGLEHPEGYKVQRLVIAWKKTLGNIVSCHAEIGLHLPKNPVEHQPRPGLSLALNIDGNTLRVLSVHLKSSCVSPLESRGNLTGGGDDCPVLQQQVEPLERWVEDEAEKGGKLILLGDFNRNFWHELRDQSLVRTDGSSPAGARPEGVLSRSILKEIVDGTPPATTFVMLPEKCALGPIGQLLCTESEVRPITAAEREFLGSRDNLGCRNPVGLDHILVGAGVTSKEGASHVGIGALGGTRGPQGSNPDPILAISDHCPMIARINF